MRTVVWGDTIETFIGLLFCVYWVIILGRNKETCIALLYVCSDESIQWFGGS